MAETIDYGYQIPEPGDSSETVIQVITHNFRQLANHDHDGRDSTNSLQAETLANNVPSAELTNGTWTPPDPMDPSKRWRIEATIDHVNVVGKELVLLNAQGERIFCDIAVGGDGVIIRANQAIDGPLTLRVL